MTNFNEQEEGKTLAQHCDGIDPDNETVNVMTAVYMLLLGFRERRDLSHKGRLRRLEEKTIFNCEKCHPRLCSCEDRHIHGTHKSKVVHGK